MTIREAVNTLELNRPFAYSELQDAIDMAIEALEKQVPKKVDVWANGKEYCPRCEQALKWD